MTNLPAGLPPVAGEETYIEQILRNLLGNAAKYGGDGQVTISAIDRGRHGRGNSGRLRHGLRRTPR